MLKHNSIINIVMLLAVVTMLFSCKIEPKPIDYGKETCHYCSMTIVDNQHAAEIITSKGKVYKFDAVECMLNEMRDNDINTLELFLVNDYHNPGVLIDAKTCTYIITPAIPSPMGDNLTAFADEQKAIELKEEKGGYIFNWTDLKKQYRVNNK